MYLGGKPNLRIIERYSLRGGEEYKEIMDEGRRKSNGMDFIPLSLALLHNKTNESRATI